MKAYITKTQKIDNFWVFTFQLRGAESLGITTNIILLEGKDDMKISELLKDNGYEYDIAIEVSPFEKKN